MRGLKFDERDRQLVITEIEKILGVSLAPVSGRRKFLEDRSGRTYWVLGGYDNWHGIPNDMFILEKARKSDGVMVVAKRYKSRIDIYTGKLHTLIKNERLLSNTSSGDLQFNILLRNNIMIIKEIHEYYLHKIHSIDLNNIINNAYDNNKHIRITRSLTHNQRKELLKQILSVNTNH